MEKARRSATVTVRTAPNIKEEASEIYKQQYGLSLSDAINMFLHRTVKTGGFPFEIKNKQEDSQSSS